MKPNPYVPHFQKGMNIVLRSMQLHIGLKLRLGMLGMWNMKSWPSLSRKYALKEQ